jgi:hypothetical protein
MRAQTLKCYIQTYTQFLAFVLCAAASNNDGPQMDLAPPILNAGQFLIQKLEPTHSPSSKPECANAIHKLVMSILSRVHPPNDLFTCPVACFIIYVNVLPLGKIHDPGAINSMLMELKWPSRASTFWEIVQQTKVRMDSTSINR